MLTVAIALVIAAGGCSSGPSADEWATTVCGALGPWRAEITGLNGKAAAQMAGATTTSQTRANLVELVSGAERASETARAAVAGAGVPDVDGGDAAARSFVAVLTGTRDAYAQARVDLAALSTSDDDEFYDGVEAVLERLNTAYAASSVGLTNVDSPELRKALDGLPACR